MQKLTLLESVSSRSSEISSEVNQFSARHHVFSDSPSFFSRLEFTVLDARSATWIIPVQRLKPSRFIVRAAPSTTRGHALYFRPRETKFLLLKARAEI